MASKLFKKVERNGEFIWTHVEKPVWIVKYEAIKGGIFFRKTFYQAFRAIHPVPKGRNPWSIDNRKIGTDDGFPTLKSAMEAAA